MCDVCVADQVLAAKGRGRSMRWSKSGAPSVQVRAKGNDSEGPAEYQMRRKGEHWPKVWLRTDDLAGVMGTYGFDVHWYAVRPVVKAWVEGKRRLPTIAEVQRSKRTPIVRHLTAD
jgi:hypothetical protein